MNEVKKRVDVIATTISGSMSDWEKIDRLRPAFKQHYSGPSQIHIVDSHAEAQSKAQEVVKQGGRIIVSAGGAGTFNSVLEGCLTTNGLPKDLRLVFLRKGSADLIGKVLRIPDNLSSAIRIISQSIEEDRIVQADVIEVEGIDINGNQWKRHFIGFGGVGVFGDIPYFTENRLVKYYKGLLGTLLGDRGPFVVGANCALIKHYIDNLLQRTPKFSLIVDNDLTIPPDKYNSVIILNGDLGKDFPLAKGILLDSGYFQTVAIRDLDFFTSYRQLIHCWKGDIFDYSEQLGTRFLKTKKKLKIIPEDSKPYMVNIDGLLMRAKGIIRYCISGQVKLITG